MINYNDYIAIKRLESLSWGMRDYTLKERDDVKETWMVSVPVRGSWYEENADTIEEAAKALIKRISLEMTMGVNEYIKETAWLNM